VSRGRALRHVAGALALVVAAWAGGALAADKPADKAAQGALLPKDSRDAGVFRGGLVYANYCVTCHGFNADGNGRAARLYNPRPANLRMRDKNDAYLGLIIRMGGEAMGRSPTYLRSINARP
jgi:cytochrome c1